MKKVKLGEVCEILSGYAFKSSQFNDKKIGLPLIRIRDVERGFSDTYFEGDFPKEYLIHRGDLLITMDGSFIMKKWEGDLALLNQRVCKLRITDENVDEGYLSWMIPKFLKEIEDKTPFVTVKHLSVAKIKNISFFLPDIQEQKIISKKLDTIRQIYNFRKKQSEKYNELVKSRFNEMFEEYPDSVFLDTYIKELRAGKSLAGEENNKNKVLKTGAVSYDYFNSSEVKNLPIDYIPLDEHKVEIGDVIISRMNTSELVGAAGYVWTINSDNIYLPDRLWKVVLNDRVNPVFLWKLITNEITKLKIKRIASGTSGSMKNISKSKFLQIRVPLPPLSLQNEFADFVAQVDKSQLAIQKSLEELETLKKSLMQEYFG